MDYKKYIEETYGEDWQEFRDELIKSLALAWFLHRDIQRLPGVLERVRAGERVRIRDASRVMGVIFGIGYFGGSAAYHGFAKARRGRELEERARRRREHLRRVTKEEEQREADREQDRRNARRAARQ